MEDYQKCLILLSLIIMYFYYINNRKETFENLDTFIKTTNNGQWNFSSYNPYANLKDYTDSFILLYSDNGNDETNAMGYKEILKYNKEKLDKFFNNAELNNQIKTLLNKYNKTDNKVLITNTEFRKMGLEYVYTVPLMTAYDKLNYIKNKTRLKTSINNFLIKDLRKYIINKYIEKKSITNQIDTDDSIIVELKYILLDGKTITNSDSTYTTKVLKKIKKYLKFDIINNGTSITNGSTDIDIKFKIINYDNSENIVSIINTKIERLYDILFTEILNTNDVDNILHFIQGLISSEDDLKNISLYGSDSLKNISLDISPNCSVPSGDKIILNTYKFDFNKTGSYGISTSNNLNYHKNTLLSGIVTGNNSNYYNCNIYDISYNLNNDSKFKLNIYDNINHFEDTSEHSHIEDEDISNNKYGVMYNNNVDSNNFDRVFNINIPPSPLRCTTNSLDTSSTQIKTQLDNLSNIKGLDKRAKDNVKAILFANLNLESFKNHLNQNLEQKDYLIKLRIIGKAFNFLESIKDADTLNNSIVKQLKLNKENSIDITEDRLIAAVYYIIEKHLRENNNEFKLKEKLLFNNETLRKRSDIIKSYIPETTNSELEKLFFMTTREKIDYFDNNTNVRNTIELELKLIEKMKTSELETYFKEVNLLKKDVNDRLKIIISSNSNNILRIHKKLNNIAGGKFNKFKGGTSVCNTIDSNNQEIGTLSKDGSNNFIITGSTLTEGESAIAIYDQDIIDTSTDDKISAYHHLKLIMKANDIVDIYKYNHERQAFSSETLSTDSNINSGGKLYKAHNLDNDNLLLHSYNNMTIKDVTSNINSMAYHNNNKIYVVGNSGYFCVADLSDKVFNTVILKDKDNKITQNYENLNHICIDNDICLIVGDNGVYINGVLSSTPNTFNIFYCDKKKDFNECLIIKNSSQEVKKYAIANNNELFQIPESECEFNKLTIGGGENNNELIPIKLIDKNDISNITKGTVLNISIEKNSKTFKKDRSFIQRFPKGIKYIVEEFDPSSSELNIKMRVFWEGIDFGNDLLTLFGRMNLKRFPDNIQSYTIYNRNNELLLYNNTNSQLVVDIEKKKYTTSEILKIRNYYNGNLQTDVNKSNNVSQGTVLYIESDEQNQNLKSNRIKYIIDKFDHLSKNKRPNTQARLFYENSTVGDKELFRYKNFKNMFILTYKDDIFLITGPGQGKKATIYKNLTPEEYNKYNEKHLYNDVNSVKEIIKKGTVLNATFSNNPHFPDELEDGLKFIVESTTPNLVVRRFWEDIDLDDESDNKKMIEYWTHPDRINSPRLSTATIDIENNKIKLNIAHEYFFVNIEETLTDDEIQTKRNERIASISDNKQKGGTSNDYKLKNLTKLNDTLLFLIINDTNTQLWYLNTTDISNSASDSGIVENCDNMFMGDNENGGLYLIYIKNNVITFDSISIDLDGVPQDTCSSNKIYKTRLYLDTNERITSLTVNVDTISMITNKLNYYKFNNPYNNSDSYLHTFNMKIASDNNIEKPKLFSIPSQSTDYINLFNYGTAGQIINYNINNINQEDIKITNNSPIFSGYDNNNNAVFTFNTNKDYPKMFTLNYKGKSGLDKQTDIRLYDNQNSYLYKNNKRIIRYNNYTPDITNYDIKVFSIRNNNYVNIPVSNTNNYNLLSNKVNIKINKFTEINKNEFVSLALFINDKFKIWLKPELDNNFNSYTYILDFKNNTSYKIKLYINGREQSDYILNKPINNSINISAIIYNGMNIYNNDTISLTDVSVNKLNLFIVPESESASVLYEKSYVSNKLISNIDKNDKMISIGIKNGTQFKLHNIKIVSSNKIYTNLTDYELNYLLEIDINKAYNYLKKINKFDLTIRYLLEKYRAGEEEDVQIYLSLIKSKSDRDNLQNTLINSFTDEERTYYIKNYLNSNKKYNIPENEDSSTSDKIVNKIGNEKNKLLESLKIKLDKLKIEKEILSNQYKIEQRNRMFEKMDADKLVKKKDINKLEEEITDVDNIIKESEKKRKSKSFFSKLLSFFSTEETNDLSLVERLTQEDKEKIVEKKLELKQQLEEMNNEDKLKEIEGEYNINLEKLRLENKVKLERERNNLEEKIKNGEISAINGDLEIKKDIIENEKINLEMDKLFSVQKNLIKKQKSLLKIIKPKEKILPEINNKKLNTLFTKIDKTMNESNNNFQQLNNSNLLQTTEATNIVNTQLNNIEEKINTNNEPDIDTTKNIIKDFKEAKKERKAQKDTKIKTDILNDIDSEIKKEKLIKKGKKPCVSFIDCYFKGLDDNFYTSYKKENTFIKDSSLPKTKKPTCKPKKDCNVCYLETEGVPNSIIYNNSYSNNSLNLNIKGNINSRFMNDYTDLPDCPFDTCMSCENINNYSLFNNKTFNDKLMEKYTKN